MLHGQRQRAGHKDVKAAALVPPLPMRRVALLLIILLGASFASASHWTPHQEIDNGNGNAAGIDVATGSDGKAIAVWRQNPGSHKVYANLYIPGEGWQGAHHVSAGSDSVCDPRIAMTHSGTAIVTWGQGANCGDGGEGRDAWAAVYSPGQAWPNGWGTPQRIETRATPVVGLVNVAVGGAGHAVATWMHDDATRTMWAARYSPGSGWGGATQLSTQPASEVTLHRAAVDGQGRAWAIWIGAATAGDEAIRVMAARLDGSWSAPVRLDQATAEANSVLVALDGAGKGYAAWQADGKVMVARHDGSWGTPKELSTPGAPAVLQDLEAWPSGGAMVLWLQNVGERQKVVHVSRHTGSWSPAETISTHEYRVTQADLAVDRYGNAVAFWVHQYGTQSPIQSTTKAWSARYTPAGWAPAEEIRSLTSTVGTAEIFTTPRAATAGANTVAIWLQFSYPSLATNAFGSASTSQDPAPELDLTSPGTYTRSSHVRVAGTTTPGAQLLVAGQQVAVNPATGAFEALIERADGKHTLTVAATNAGGTTTKTATTTVDTVAPNITVESPAHGSSTTSSSVTVRAKTETGASATINGFQVSVGAGGIFSRTVSLAQGPNVIELSATDPAGNVARTNITVTFGSTDSGGSSGSGGDSGSSGGSGGSEGSGGDSGSSGDGSGGSGSDGSGSDGGSGGSSPDGSGGNEGDSGSSPGSGEGNDGGAGTGGATDGAATTEDQDVMNGSDSGDVSIEPTGSRDNAADSRKDEGEDAPGVGLAFLLVGLALAVRRRR